MHMSRRELLALGSVAVAGTALGPSPAQAETPRRGGFLTIRGWDPPFFDPMLSTAYRVNIPLTFTQQSPSGRFCLDETRITVLLGLMRSGS